MKWCYWFTFTKVLLWFQDFFLSLSSSPFTTVRSSHLARLVAMEQFTDSFFTFFPGLGGAFPFSFSSLLDG